MEAHHAKILNTVHKTGHMISRLIHPHHHPSIRVVRQLIHSILIPQIAYSLPFIRCTQEYIRRLETAILAPARKILSLPDSTPKQALLVELGLPSITELRDGILCCMRSRTSHQWNINNHRNTRMLHMLIPASVEKVAHILSLYHNHDEGISALRRQRVTLSIVDEIATAEHRLHVSSDDDRHRIRDMMMKSSYDVLRHDHDHRGEVVARLKSSSTCSAYIMHDGILGASLRARLRLRRTSLNFHQYRMDVINHVPYCMYCANTYHDGVLEHVDVDNEDIDHVLLHCPQYDTARQQLIDSMHEKNIDITFNAANILCSDECIASLRSTKLKKDWIHMTEKYIVSIFNVRGSL